MTFDVEAQGIAGQFISLDKLYLGSLLSTYVYVSCFGSVDHPCKILCFNSTRGEYVAYLSIGLPHYLRAESSSITSRFLSDAPAIGKCRYLLSLNPFTLSPQRNLVSRPLDPTHGFNLHHASRGAKAASAHRHNNARFSLLIEWCFQRDLKCRRGPSRLS